MSGFLRKLHNRWLAVLMAGMIATVGTGCGEVPSRFMQAADAGAVSVHSSEMEVHYINVGQGDSTLIKCGSEAMLIDAGDDTQGTNIRYYLRKQNVKALKYLVLTHPDSDHIGGAPSVIENVSVGAVYVSDFDKDTKTSEKVDEALKQEGITPEVPSPGQTEELGTAKVRFLAPCGEYEDANDSSVALKVTDGNKSFLFTGDAETEAEHDMIASGEDLRADVYKAGHHGSRNASSEAFLKAVQPSCVVISCGEGNKYGHPSSEAMNRFRSDGLKVYRTDEQGTIVAETDGRSIKWNMSPSDTWRSGEAEGAGDAGGGTAVSGKTAGSEQSGASAQVPSETSYIINTNTRKFHRAGCPNAAKIKASNRKVSDLSRDELIKEGYSPCKNCRP